MVTAKTLQATVLEEAHATLSVYLLPLRASPSSNLCVEIYVKCSFSFLNKLQLCLRLAHPEILFRSEVKDGLHLSGGP